MTKYKILISIPKGKFSQKELKIKEAMATLYASSPYLKKVDKDNYIKSLFRKSKKR